MLERLASSESTLLLKPADGYTALVISPIENSHSLSATPSLLTISYGIHVLSIYAALTPDRAFAPIASRKTFGRQDRIEEPVGYLVNASTPAYLSSNLV